MLNTEATQYIKATLAEFGLCTHASAIQLRQETWAKLHEAMSVLIEQPAQHQPQAIHQWRRIDKPKLGWFDDTHERAYHADPKMEGRTLYSTPQPAQQEPLTDEEIMELLMPVRISGDGYFLRISRAIEAAHGIRSKT